MNLEKLLNLILSNPDKIKIEYTCVNGQESLKVNGKEISEEKFDDSPILERVEYHKQVLNELDDCLFMEIMDVLKSCNTDFNKVNDLMEQEHYNKQEAEQVTAWMDKIENIIIGLIRDKIEHLTEILNQLI